MTATLDQIATYCLLCSHRSHTGPCPREEPMELDQPSSQPLPPPRNEPARTHTALEEVDLMRRFLAWIVYRYHLPNNISLGKLELDHATVKTLLVKRDSAGNALMTIDQREMGS